MKNKIILLMLISISLFAQDWYASPFSLKWGASSTPRVLNIDSFSVNKFMLGFQWSGTSNMRQKLLMNSTSGSVGFQLDSTSDEQVDLIHEPLWFSRHPYTYDGITPIYRYEGLHIGLISFLEFDPRLKITDETLFKPIPNDPKNSIFGWKYNLLNLADTIGLGNRIAFRKDSSYKDSVVLKNIFPSNQFESYITAKDDDGQLMNENWNLTINLRRLNIALDTVKNDSVVLEIRLPYTYKILNTNTFGHSEILFYRKPFNSLNGHTYSINYSENRGIALDTVSVLISDTMRVLKITKNMLPTDINNKDITISAQFRTMFKLDHIVVNDSGAIPAINNSYIFANRNFKYGLLDTFKFRKSDGSFKWGGTYPNEQIDSIDIEVTYRGNCDVAVNYIRIESNRAQRALRGAYDAHDKDIIQKCLDTLASYEVAGKKKYKTIRFLSREYESGNPLFWGQLRYLNKVTNGMTTTRGSQYLQKHYEYYTGNPNSYYGMKFNEWEILMPVPYYRFGIQGNPNYLGFKSGFKARNDSSQFYNSYDSLQSGYETSYGTKSFYDFPKFNKNNEDSVKLFANWLIGSVSTNAFIPELEAHDIGNYYLKSVRDFIYSDKPHYMNFFAAPIVDTTKTYVSFTSSHYQLINALLRPKTGEEVRYLQMKSVLMGAKGLYYDREEQSPNNSTFVHFLGIGDGLKIDSTHGLFDKLVGADFLNDTSRDVYKLMKYMNIDLLSDSLKVNRNRIYFGLQSTRSELFKLHSFIRDNEDLLLKLKIQSWVGKGLYYWKTQHSTNFSDTLDVMKQFIDYENIKTRKLYLPNIQGNYADNSKTNFESKDSTYFDLMLHKKDSIPLSQQFYFGIMNRRTSPLINIQLTGETTTMQKYFASSYEFDNGIINGDTIYKFDTYNSKEFKNSDYWKSYYLKRDGVREITIPFSFKPTNNYDYCLLHVKEIHDTSSSYISNIRNATKTKLIDTVIRQDAPLSMIMLPGEGKLFSVEIIYPQTNIVGKLDYSNQNKICEYKDTTNMTTYYATFFKKDTISVSSNITRIINRVYFAQSYPTHRDSGSYTSPTPIQGGSPNVRWFTPMPVSNYLIDHNGSNISSTYSNNFFSCEYPSLVVGKDSSGERKAFVVYQCVDTLTDKRLMIVESIIKLYNDLTPPQLLSNVRIGEAFYDSINTVTLANAKDEFGTPSINYSKDGNFYAWTTRDPRIEKLNAIIYGYKPRNQVYLTTLDTIKPFHVSVTTESPRRESMFRHPGMNPYSQIQSPNTSLDSNENEAMLAFQFAKNDDVTNNIFNDYLYYTKLRLNTSTGKVYHFLRDYADNLGIQWKTTTDAMRFHNNNRIVQFRWAARMASKPSCFRSPELLPSLSDFNYTPIYFERRYYPNISQMVGFEILERKISNNWYINRVSHISPSPDAFSYDLGNPHIGNAQQVSYDTNYNAIYSGLGLVNFTWGERVYNIPISENYQLSDSGYSNTNLILSRINYVADGKLPHLANSPVNNKSVEIWRNRRLFNTLDSVEKIVPSARYFYKKNENGDEITELFGFESDTLLCTIGKAYLSGSELRIKLPYSLVDSIYVANNSDTLYSDWFTLSTTAQLSLVYKSKLFANHFASYIERKDSTSHFMLPLVDNCDTCLSLVNATLINGGGHQYRYVLRRLDTLSRYSIEILLGNISYGDTLYYKTNNKFNKTTIDLATYKETFSKVYPNPSDGKINLLLAVDYDRESKITLLISDITGQVIKELTTDYKDQIKLDMSNVTNGSYILQIKGNKHDKPTTETLQFKISK